MVFVRREPTTLIASLLNYRYLLSLDFVGVKSQPKKMSYKIVSILEMKKKRIKKETVIYTCKISPCSIPSKVIPTQILSMGEQSKSLLCHFFADLHQPGILHSY